VEEEDFDNLVVPVSAVVVGASHIAVVPDTTVVMAVDTHMDSAGDIPVDSAFARAVEWENKYTPTVERRGTHKVSSKEFSRPL